MFCGFSLSGFHCLVFIVCLMGCCALVGLMIGSFTNRPARGAVLGAFLWPIGWLFPLAFMAGKTQSCPNCRSIVDSGLDACPYCRATASDTANARE